MERHKGGEFLSETLSRAMRLLNNANCETLDHKGLHQLQNNIQDRHDIEMIL